jgi:hypothetical protein
LVSSGVLDLKFLKELAAAVQKLQIGATKKKSNYRRNFSALAAFGKRVDLT